MAESACLAAAQKHGAEAGVSGCVCSGTVIRDLQSLRRDFNEARAAGKSTLLKLMCGDLYPTRGDIKRHSHLVIGRYHQHSVDVLDDKMEVTVQRGFPWLSAAGSSVAASIQPSGEGHLSLWGTVQSSHFGVTPWICVGQTSFS